MNILFLCNRPSENSQASTVTDYLNALKKYSVHKVYEIPMLHHFPSKIDLEKFDIVITHYSLSLGPQIEHYLGKNLIEKLKKYNGLKISFLQDEYRDVRTYWKNLNELGIDILFSCVPTHEISNVYPPREVPNLKVVNVLTGYIPESLTSFKQYPIKNRPIDVGYRTRKTPFWLGRLGYEKVFIADEFKKKSINYNLNINFSTNEGDRLYGNKWVEFVSSCKTIIGVESGASIVDFDGLIEKNVESYIRNNTNVSFEEVFDKFLIPYESNICLNQISPRCFEAAVLKTPMILFEGKYSGILKPHRHYIPLKKDFSNFDYIIKKINDPHGLQKMADIVYEEIALNPKLSYQNFIKKVDKVINKEFKIRKKIANDIQYSTAEFNKHLVLSVGYTLRRNITMFFQKIFLGNSSLRRIVFRVWELSPERIQKIIRPLARAISR